MPRYQSLDISRRGKFRLNSGVNAFLGLDGREQAEGMVVGRELIVAGCNPPTLFDLVEKPT
jgi:hypothetical protein